MSGPRIKRPFAGSASDPAQRQITSFFKRDAAAAGTDESVDDLSSSSAAAAAAAHLPANVQANLLSVGMRVRKSVPEGYKTGLAYGSFSLWSDADPTPTGGTARIPDAAPPLAGEQRELLPFCGIHKVGGLASQPADSYDAPPLFPASAFDASLAPPPMSSWTSDVPSIDDCPGLTSSQESAASVDDLPAPCPAAAAAHRHHRKRFYAEDERVEKPVSLRDEWLDGEVSPRTLAPVGWDNGRIMAVPKRRGAAPGRPKSMTAATAAAPASLSGVAAAATTAPARLTDLGQENLVGLAVDGGAGSDFEEANFLDYDAWGTRDMEMGGV